MGTINLFEAKDKIRPGLGYPRFLMLDGLEPWRHPVEIEGELKENCTAVRNNRVSAILWQPAWCTKNGHFGL